MAKPISRYLPILSWGAAYNRDMATSDAVAAVNSALQNTPGVLRTLVSGLGSGARMLDES